MLGHRQSCLCWVIDNRHRVHCLRPRVYNRHRDTVSIVYDPESTKTIDQDTRHSVYGVYTTDTVSKVSIVYDPESTTTIDQDTSPSVEDTSSLQGLDHRHSVLRLCVEEVCCSVSQCFAVSCSVAEIMCRRH